MKTIYMAAAMASALSLSTPANAGFFDFTLAPFIGASAGQATFDTSCAVGETCDDTDTAWKIMVDSKSTNIFRWKSVMPIWVKPNSATTHLQPPPKSMA
jgi:hypothetical protein